MENVIEQGNESSEIGNQERHICPTSNKLNLQKYFENRKWAYMERLAYKQKVCDLLKLQSESWGRAEVVLDVGCHEGAVMSYSRDFAEASHIIGIDISRLALMSAKKRTEFDFVLATAENLPFRQNILDTVLCLNIIEHLNRPWRCLGELSRVLKISGICLVVLPNELTSCRGIARNFLRNPIHRIYKRLADLIFPDQGHKNFFTPNSFRKLCKECHLEILMTYCDAFIWMELPFTFIFDLIHPKLKYFIKKLVTPLMKYEIFLWFTDSMAFYIQTESLSDARKEL